MKGKDGMAGNLHQMTLEWLVPSFAAQLYLSTFLFPLTQLGSKIDDNSFK